MRKVDGGKWAIRAIYGVVFILAIMLCLQLLGQHNALAKAGQTLPELSFGPEKAKVTVVEFMDYRCLACRLSASTVNQAMEEFPEVRFVIRHFPVFGKQSVIEADIAITAARHGKFKEMHDLLLSREAPVEDAEIDGLLRTVGLDINPDQFREEMRQAGNGEIMHQTLNIADRLGLRMTPTFIIGKTIYVPTQSPPPIEDFRRLIAEARAGK